MTEKLYFVDRTDASEKLVIERALWMQPAPKHLALTYAKWLENRHPEHRYVLREAKANALLR